MATTLWQVSGGLMNVFGAVITLMGFLGGSYESYLALSYSTYGSSSAKFNSAVVQTVSGIIGFIAVTLGFIEVFISYLPYQDHSGAIVLTTGLLVFNAVFAIILLGVRTILIRFYKGLWLINFYFTERRKLCDRYVRKVMRTNRLSVQDGKDAMELRRLSWRNWRLLLRISGLSR